MFWRSPAHYSLTKLLSMSFFFSLREHCIFCFHRAILHSSATLTGFSVLFSSLVRQMPGYNSQRRGTAHTLPS